MSNGLARWTVADSAEERALLADGYERTGHRRYVMAEFWSELLVKTETDGKGEAPGATDTKLEA